MSETLSEPEIPIETRGDDLEAVLGAAWDKLEAESNAPFESAPAELASEPSARDEHGRFVSAQSAEPEIPEPPASIADKDAWKTTPASVREAIIAREAAVKDESEKLSKVSTEYDPIRVEIDKHRPMLAATGVDAATAVRNLLNAQAALQDRPAEVIAQLAKQYRVDLTQFTPRQAPQQHQDPTVRRLEETVARLTQQLEQRSQQEQQSTVQSQQAQIQAFARDNPHFEDVRNIMGGLIQTGQAADLKTAYDMACYASPAIRAKLLASERQTQASKAQQEADAARRRGSSVTPSRAASGEQRRAAPKDERVEDTLAANYDRLFGAA